MSTHTHKHSNTHDTPLPRHAELYQDDDDVESFLKGLSRHGGDSGPAHSHRAVAAIDADDDDGLFDILETFIKVTKDEHLEPLHTTQPQPAAGSQKNSTAPAVSNSNTTTTQRVKRDEDSDRSLTRYDLDREIGSNHYEHEHKHESYGDSHRPGHNEERYGGYKGGHEDDTKLGHDSHDGESPTHVVL